MVSVMPDRTWAWEPFEHGLHLVGAETQASHGERPSAPGTLLSRMPVPSFFTVMDVPGRIPPELSFTIPEIVPAISCAHVGDATHTIEKINSAEILRPLIGADPL